MKRINVKIDTSRLKNLVQHGLKNLINFTTEVYYNDTDYLIISVKDGIIYITAIYQNNILTHMSDVSYSLFLDIIGELDYSTNDFKEIISNYI